MTSFASIIVAKAPSKSWSSAALARFHYFNDNGIVAAKRALDDRIRAAVDAGKVPSGWHFAYGSFNDYHVKKLRELAARTRVKSWDVNYAVAKLEELIADVDQKLSTL
jgi:hypothetical protein